MTETRLPSARRVNACYVLVHVAYWAAYAALAGYQTALLLDRGFTSGQAGAVAAARYLAGLLTQPAIGGWADRHPEVPIKRLFGVGLLGALAVSILFYLTRPGLAGTMLIFAALGTLELNAYPLLDSMAVQYINAGVDVHYSVARGMGSFSYAVACVFLGRQAARFGMESILLSHAALAAVLVAAVAVYPAFPAAAPAERIRPAAPHSVGQLLRGNRSYTRMLGAVFFAMLAVLPLSSFMVSVVGDRGGGSTALGWAMFFMAAVELPAAFLYQRLRRRVAVRGILLLSLVFIALKPVLTLLTSRVGQVLALQPVQLLGYGLFVPASVYYANENVPPEDRVRGQEIMMIAASGLSGMASNLLAGRLIDLGGVQVMLAVCSVCGAVSVALGIAAVRTAPGAAAGPGT
jgi:PPP family 3-phenylpropionic acid transporter